MKYRGTEYVKNLDDCNIIESCCASGNINLFLWKIINTLEPRIYPNTNKAHVYSVTHLAVWDDKGT